MLVFVLWLVWDEINSGIGGCLFPEYVEVQWIVASGNLQVKKVDRILFFMSGSESEIGMYGIKVLVDCTDINEFGVIYCPKHVETELKWNIYLFDCIRLVFSFKKS